MADQQDRDTHATPNGAGLTPPPAGAGFTPAEPLAESGVEFTPATGAGDEEADAGTIGGAKQALKDNGARVREQATDKARLFAEDGKARATSALGQLTDLLNDAAVQVDEKLGSQYGQYARSAADRVQGLSSSIDAKSVDDLVGDVRELVRKSPAAAVGAAAAIGFVVARLLSAGIDQRDA
jgi:ElaB/YqjD/DUF883 family membrane-anchored ribosome-binding protein